jgi:pimeloyl-ACP methyl ester carboxylesterase
VAVILLHGAWQGRWAWDTFLPYLREAGLDPHAVDFPGNGTDDVDPAAVSLDLYVASVVSRIDAIGGRVSIVAHSGSGVVASQVAQACPEKIERLAYVAGMMLPDGTAFADVVGSLIAEDPGAGGIAPYLVWSQDRLTSTVPPAAAKQIFFHDCPAEAADAAASRLTPQPERGRAVRPRLTSDRFGRVPRPLCRGAGGPLGGARRPTPHAGDGSGRARGVAADRPCSPAHGAETPRRSSHSVAVDGRMTSGQAATGSTFWLSFQAATAKPSTSTPPPSTDAGVAPSRSNHWV